MPLAASDLVLGLLIGAAALGVLLATRGRLLRALGLKRTETTVGMIDRVRAVGRLVSLEVCAKEIATSQTAVPWIPEIVFRGRKLAMIFQFEKQYFVDLARVRADDVVRVDGRRWRLTLPPLESVERMTSMEPYDIQNGKLLGLLDILPNDAAAQRDLTKRAQEQALSLFRLKDEQYLAQARASAERHLRALLAMFDVDLELAWVDRVESAAAAAAAPAAPVRT